MPIVISFRVIAVSPAKTCVCLLLGLLAGCGTPDEIRPQGDAAAAKAALQSALDAWKAGKPPAESQTGPALVWTDEDWKADRKLSDYKLVGEPEQSGGHWRVYADLTLDEKAKKPTPTRVCYGVTLGEPTVIIRSDFLN